MSKRMWKKQALLILGGGVLLAFDGCVAIFAPAMASMLESIILTFLFGTAS